MDETFRHSSAVRAIGAKLGLSPEQAATSFEVTNFLILVVLVGWFLIKTLPKTFRDRNSAIQKHLVEARVATEEANARLTTVEDRLSRLDEQIHGMKQQAEDDLRKEEQRVKSSIEDEKRKILEAADREIQSASLEARRQLQQYASDLAIDQAAKKLVVTAETDRLLVQRFAQRLSEDGGKGDQN